MNNKEQDNQADNVHSGNSEKQVGDELLNNIQDPQTDSPLNTENKEEQHEDLLSKLGFSKKEKQKKEIDELKQKVAEANDKYMRLYAEFDNYRKRTLKERIDLIKTAGAEVIQSMLPVLDDFSRAIKQLETLKESDAALNGVRLINHKMMAALESKGLKAMKAVGETFNPEFHDAITEVQVTDESSIGKVMDEIECGYFLNEKIIRHAKVVVGK